MTNWFKKISQFDEQINNVGQQAIRYRVMIPVDIWAIPTGDIDIDQRNVYDMLKNILNNGEKSVEHQGFNSLLQPRDIKTHAEVTREPGIG